MPTLTVSQRFPFPLDVVVDFFRRPANVIAVAPASLGMTLVEAPEVLEAGSRIVVEVRRAGIRQQIITEVVERTTQRLVEEQQQGPFRRWEQSRTFRTLGPNETELEESITFEPPGGMLGLLFPTRQIEAELRQAIDQRHSRVIERLGRS